MTQPPTPPSSNTEVGSLDRYPLKTSLGKRTAYILSSSFEVVDALGTALMGDFWRAFYLSIQDAIALFLILQIPKIISRLTLGLEFYSFEQCLRLAPLGIARYACLITVSLDFVFWITLSGRILGRFWVELSFLKRRKDYRRQDSNKS